MARRRLLATLASAAVVLVACMLSPARGLAADGPWAPRPAGQAKTARTCPSPSVAAYYETTCWTVAVDPTNPFYAPDAPYPWAQCTYWALEMRPDLWNDRSPSDPDPSDWTAYTWPAHAALEGLAVDHAPSPGALVVWPRTGGDGAGHVAYVQAVAPDPATGDLRVTVQEMNDTTFDDPSAGEGDTMTLPMSALDLAGVQIIHAPGDGGGATATTGSAAAGTTTAGSTTTGSTTTGSTTTGSGTSATTTRSAAPTRRRTTVRRRARPRRPRHTARARRGRSHHRRGTKSRSGRNGGRRRL